MTEPDGPSDAERARTLVAATGSGALATLGGGGYPFGSVVVHVADEQGRPLLLLSDLAEHSRNLAVDPRASLLVAEPGGGDPLDRGRATLVGPVTELTGPEREAPLARYQAVHPGGLGTDHGFRLYRLDVRSVRFVGGFARMSWVDADAYATAEVDPLLPHVDGIVGHMNADHGEAMVLYCRAFAGRPATVEARMTGIDRYGFTMLAADEPSGPTTAVRLPFEEPADTPVAARQALVAMVAKARG